MLIGITTAPRPNGVSYLKQTMDSLRAAGGNKICVFAEPDSDLSELTQFDYLKDPGTSISWATWGYRIGNYGNWFLSSGSMLGWAKESQEDWILMCEDDVRFGSEPLSEIEMTLALLQDEHGDSTGPLLVYTSSVYQDRMEPGIKIIDSRSLIGSCAMLWPVAALKRVVECDRAKNWRGIGGQDSGAEIHHSDTAIGMCCDDLGLKIFAMRPCVCQHIGAISSLHQFANNPEMFASHVKE